MSEDTTEEAIIRALKEERAELSETIRQYAEDLRMQRKLNAEHATEREATQLIHRALMSRIRELEHIVQVNQP